MRKLKLYSLLLGGLFISGTAFAYTDPTFLEATKVNNTAYNQKVAYRRVKLVRFANRNLPLVASGDAVSYDQVSADSVSVRLSGTSPSPSFAQGTMTADGSFAGIACTAPTTSADANSTVFSDDNGRNNWFYIVTRGPASAKTSAGGTNNAQWGDPFVVSRDSGAICTIEDRTSAVTASTNSIMRAVSGKGGFFMQSADGTSTVYTVYVEKD